MHCKSCEMLIKDELMELGVTRCDITLDLPKKSGQATVIFDESKLNQNSIKAAIKKLGYQVN